MDGFGYPFSKRKTTEQLMEEQEHLKAVAENEELQLSIAEKQALRGKLEVAGLTVRKDFGGSVKKAWQWLNKTK